ncbi:MAG: ribonuclease P protein component [Xanthomonadales bacterium]|nr:ribonuclease P protein component [Xanthomonadales bacterium]
MNGGFFAIRYGPSAGTTARMGMAVSRKVSKRAVVRNRIKRQVRESFRHQRASLPFVDMLVIARSTAATADNSALRLELDQLWARLKVSSARLERQP